MAKKSKKIGKEFLVLRLEDIHPYENNPRLNEDAVPYVVESIKQCTDLDPIEVDENNVILSGHTRLLAMQQLGYKEADCIRYTGLTEAQKKKYRLLANKVAEKSFWDFDKLPEELEGLDFDDFDFGFGDLEGLGYDAVSGNTDDDSEAVEDDYDEELPEEPKANLGDLYQLGNHRLICGDSTDVAVIDRLMDGVKADMVFTDPPYGMNAVSKSGVLSEHYKTDIMNDDDNTVAIDAFNLAREYFKDAKQIWWGANYYTECLPSSECWIVWDKNNGASDQTDCELAWANMRSVVRQFTMASEKTNRVHPTQKPCKLFAEIIHKFDKDNSVKNVVDLFGGSGSTLIACEQLNRKCYMCELDPRYVDVIIDRWEKFTGKKAVKLN
jgi:DNA modification methylase